MRSSSTRFRVCSAVAAVAAVAAWRHWRKHPLRGLLRLQLGQIISVPDLTAPMDWLGGIFSSVGDDIKNFVRNAIQVALNALGTIFDGIKDLIAEAAHDANVLFNYAEQYAVGLIDDLKGWVQASWDALYNTARGWVDDVSSFLGSVIDNVSSWAHSAFDAAYQWVGDRLGELKDGILSLLDDIKGWVGDLVSIIYGWVTDRLGELKDGLLSIFADVKDWVSGLLGDIWHFIYDHAIGPLEDLLSWVTDHAAPLLSVVADALDWLVWVATIPFRDVYDFVIALRDFDEVRVLRAIGQQQRADRQAAAQQISERFRR